MNRLGPVAAVVVVLVGAGLYARHKYIEAGRTPEMNENIAGIVQRPFVDPIIAKIPEQTCYGQETNLHPEFDLALNVTSEGVRMEFDISAVETIGLEVCSIVLRINHRRWDPEFQQWEPDGSWAPVYVPRLEPGEVFYMITPVYEGEFPEVTEPGPPDAWTIEVESWSEAMVLFPLGPAYASVGASWPKGPGQNDGAEHESIDHEHAESVGLYVPHERGHYDQRNRE